MTISDEELSAWETTAKNGFGLSFGAERIEAIVTEIRRLREDLKAMRFLARQSEDRANAEWARNAYRPVLDAREAGRGGGE